MTAPTTTWAVTDIAHPGLRGVKPDCKDCLALADTAIVNASVTGSTGSTYSDNRPNPDDPCSCTVSRTFAVIVVDPSKDQEA